MPTVEKQNALAIRRLNETLALVGLPVQSNYRSGEVLTILGIGKTTFWRLVNKYERDLEGQLRRPDCLITLVLGTQRRVAYTELADFIRRNDNFLRNGLEENKDKKGGQNQ